MESIHIQVLIDGKIENVFEKLSSSNNITSSSLNNNNFSFVFNQDSNYELKLGSKFKLSYSFLRNVIKGDSDVIVTQFWKPYNFTEVWNGGIFDTAIHSFSFEQKGDKVLINYSFEGDFNFLPFKDKIIKNYILPNIKIYIGNRLSNIKNA